MVGQQLQPLMQQTVQTATIGGNGNSILAVADSTFSNTDDKSARTAAAASEATNPVQERRPSCC